MLKLLFIADPLETFKAYKDSSLAMMNAAQSAGHQVFHANADSLCFINNDIYADVKYITIDKSHEKWFEVVLQKSSSLRDFDAVVMRQDPPFNVEYLENTWLLSQAEKMGVKVFN